MGLRWPGGAPRKIEKVLSMAEEAKATIGAAIVELEAALPVDIMSGPIEGLPAAHALARVSLSGLYQLGRIVEQPLDMDNLKQQRLIGDMALGANKLFKSHAEGERNTDLIGRLLELLEAEKSNPQK
jgi:hypothetical protein